MRPLTTWRTWYRRTGCQELDTLASNLTTGKTRAELFITFIVHHLYPIIISYYLNILVKRCNLYVLILNLELVFCFSLYIIK